ncbi:MAG: protein-arginine deiminase family protein [Planctomycetota bacterium]
MDAIAVVASVAAFAAVRGVSQAQPALVIRPAVAMAVDPDGDGVFDQTAGLEHPFVLAGNLQPAETVFVREYPGRNDAMLAALRDITAQAGVELHVIPGDAPYPANHVWVQDAVEFGHAYTGEPDAMHVAMPSNRNRGLDRFAEHRLFGPDFGVISVGSYREDYAKGEGGVSWIDWYGNLEVSPPTQRHPFGRALYGYDPATGAQLNPEVVDFLAAQGVQPPMPVDVGWLTIKHVDEVLSFIPAEEGGRGFKVMVPDPGAAIDLLRGLAHEGYADTPMLSSYEEGVTVASLLADEALMDHNRDLQAQRLEPIYANLREELGLDEEHVVRIPLLFTPGGGAKVPNMVNALVINGHVVMADPDGPEIDGEDAFQKAVREKLADLPVTVHFVDDQLYQRWSGNVHCATNTIREPIVPWGMPPEETAPEETSSEETAPGASAEH